MNKFWALSAFIFFSSISAQSVVVTQSSPMKSGGAAATTEAVKAVKENSATVVPSVSPAISPAIASSSPVLNVTPELCKKVTPILHKIALKCLLESDREARCKCYDAVAVKMEVKYKNCHGMFEEIKQDVANQESAKAQSLQQKSCFSK